MNVDVRQRQYAIGIRSEPNAQLVSANFSPCIGFAGIDERNGVVFLCHLDTPFAVPSINKVIAELRKHVGTDLSNFRLYIMTGLSLWWRLFLTVAAGAFVVFSEGHLLAIGAFIAIFVPCFSTFLTLRLLLASLKVFHGKPTYLEYSRLQLGTARTGILVDADLSEPPRLHEHPRSREMNEKYGVVLNDKGLISRWRLTKAAGSA